MGGRTFNRKSPFAATSFKKGVSIFQGWAYFREIMVSSSCLNLNNPKILLLEIYVDRTIASSGIYNLVSNNLRTYKLINISLGEMLAGLP